MLGFTVINGHRGPRKVEPQRMSLAERLRRAKSNDGELEIVSARDNPSISLDLSDQELGRLMSRMVGGRVSRRSRRTEPKKGGGRKMRGKEKTEFVKRMAAGKRRKARAEGAKSNPRRRRAKHNPRRRRHAKHNPSHMYAKYNPTSAQVRASMRGKNPPGVSRALEKSVADYIKQEAAVLAELAKKSSKPSKPSKPSAKKPKSKTPAKRRWKKSQRAAYNLRMQNQINNKIVALQRRKGSDRMAWAKDARLAALMARRRSYGAGVSKAARNYLKLHGLTKVNAGGIGGQLAASGKALVGVLPEVLVAVGSAGVHTYLGSMISKKAVEKHGASYASWSGSVSSLAIGVLGFLGLRMSSATAKYSVPFLTGGVVGAGVLLLADNQTKGDAAEGIPSKSWGRALELPIGSVVLRSEFAGFDPYARHNVQSIGEVLPRSDFAGMGEVISRRDAVAMVGEAEDRALNRLLGEVSQLHADTASGF